MEYIKSPLNYTGNKFRILSQLQKSFPKDITCMIDMFCGGATVGLNSNAKKVYFVDSNQYIINLLIFLSKQKFEPFLDKLESKIKEYNLSYSYKNGYSIYRNYSTNLKDNNGLKEYNYKGFYALRDHYNGLSNKNSNEANIELYLLMVYAFNNDIRFNSSGEFNLPVGKTDLNKMNVDKVKNYIKRIQEIDAHFICADFSSPKLKAIINEADFVYMDPPYLLGDAVYNAIWDNNQEYKLLDFVDLLLEKRIDFALSNIISKTGCKNEPLSYWCHKNSKKIIVSDIKYNYRSASYNKKSRDAKEREIVISNKRV